ncbi:NUDIX domain-containing protein [Alphaproteobacteria bacterium]|nr:NUDIX domain-containing protein [Alphaproteobacteria bacterium]
MNDSLYKNNFFEIHKKNSFYYLKYPGSMVAILGFYLNKLILVKQHRGLIQEETIEVPAGASEKNENLINTAQREFNEETGIFIQDLSRFEFKYSIILDPNRFIQKSNIFHIEISKDEVNTKNKKSTSEISEVLLLSKKEIIDHLISNKINVGQTKEILLNYIFLREKNEKKK